ncbi:MAG: glycosyltransferase [Candidatus Dojkabacteria bacterium]|nr:MAG: glycosyltransferase [Candidatus Dojkabacteria bacterium]
MVAPAVISQESPSPVSLVHDFFVAWGGAEVVVDAFSQAFPDAPLYASVDFPETRHAPLDSKQIHTSFLQKFPFLKTYLLEIYKFLLPLAFSSFTFSKHTKVVLSDTSSFAKHIIPPPGAIHLSYIHTPPRFLWNMPPSKKVRSNLFLRFMWNLLFGSSFKVADYLHAQRVHGLIANSEEVAQRIRKFYRREPIAILNPPVYVKKLNAMLPTQKIEISDYFLAFGRIELYKNFDKLVKIWPPGFTLKIAGTGSQENEIKALIKNNPNITFLNEYVSDAEKGLLFAQSRGFLYPNIEDFGIMMVEAIAVGTPVITFAQGGGKEIVTHHKNGYLIPSLAQEHLIPALKWCNTLERTAKQRKEFYEAMVKYDIDSFIGKIQQVVEHQRATHEKIL